MFAIGNLEEYAVLCIDLFLTRKGRFCKIEFEKHVHQCKCILFSWEWRVGRIIHDSWTLELWGLACCLLHVLCTSIVQFSCLLDIAIIWFKCTFATLHENSMLVWSYLVEFTSSIRGILYLKLTFGWKSEQRAENTGKFLMCSHFRLFNLIRLLHRIYSLALKSCNCIF